MLTLYVSSTGMAATRLDLPMPLDEIKRQMELIRIKEQSDRAVLIYDIVFLCGPLTAFIFCCPLRFPPPFPAPFLPPCPVHTFR